MTPERERSGEAGGPLGLNQSPQEASYLIAGRFSARRGESSSATQGVLLTGRAT